MQEETFSDQEDYRILKLNDALVDAFGDLHPDEVDEVAGRYIESETVLIDIVKVGSHFCLAASVYDDAIYALIEFPETVRRYLRPGDSLLVTMGFSERVWTVLYSSTCCDSAVWH